MAQNDNITKLHGLLQKAGYNDIGSEEQFRNYVSNESNAKKLHGLLRKEGYNDIGDESTFLNWLGTGQATQQAPAEHGKGLLGRAKDAMQALSANVQQQGQKKMEEAKMKPQPVASQPQQKPTPVEQPQQTPQEDERGMLGRALDKLQSQFNTVNPIGSPENQVKQARQRADQWVENAQRISPFGDGNVSIGINSRLRKGKQSFNAETGQFEDTYLTSNGQSFKNIAQANEVQENLNQLEDYERFKSNMEAIGISDITGEQDLSVEDRLKKAYAEKEALQAKIEKGRYDQAGRMARAGLLAGSAALSDKDWANAKEYDNLLSAMRLVDRRITALEAERDDAGFWQGTGDVLSDPSSYSFGLTDASDAMALNNIKQKIEAANGGTPNLTAGEKILARNYLMNQEAQQLNNNRGWLYGAGQGFGQTLSFMADFAVTGGGFAGLAKKGLRMGTKAGLKYAGSDAAKWMTKNLGVAGKALNKTIQYGTKYGGMALGAEVGGTMLANTVQLPKTLANITDRYMGDLAVGKDGNLEFKGGEELGKTILFEELKAIGENASELVGPAFDIMPGLLGRVIKRTAVGKGLQKLTSNKFWRAGEKGLDFLGVQSVWGEGMEEEYGMLRTSILNTVTGNQYDPNAESIGDLDTQLNTWATVGLTSALLRAPQMIASGRGAANYYGYKYNLNASDKNMRSVFGNTERYDAIKSMLDGATNQNIGNVLNSIMTQAQLSNEEKEAVVYYAQDLVNLRGYNMGSVVAESMGVKPQPRVDSYRINGNTVEELDKDGNVLSTHEYENRDEMKAGLYEMQQQRFESDLQSDISVMQARPDYQYDRFVVNFLVENDFGRKSEDPIGDFEAILAKPSLERTDEEQQLVQQFAKVLHNAVYDNTMLHEEQSDEDGATAAENASVDMEAPASPELIETAAAWFEAQEARSQLFANNEELKQEIESMEQQGMSHQEIISALETFAPNEVDAVINYYNQKARFESMMNRVNDKIDEEAANSRQRHTFKGTMNGQPDTSNIYTISDGTNEYYLVSGNIIVSPEGQITDSTSGLIIGMDSDGSFVQLSDTSGYSVMPSQLSADDFEATERERLQQLWTSAIDPTGSMMQQTEQGETVGGEAGATTGTGANEPPTTSPLVQETAADRIPKDEGGNMLYEQGAPEDTYDVLSEQTGGEQGAKVIATAQLKAATTELGKLQRKLEKGELQGNTIQEQIAETQALQQAIAAAQAKAAYWQSVLDVPTNRNNSQNNLNVGAQQNNEAEKPVSSPTNSTPTNGALTAEELKQQRIAEAKAKYGELFDDDFTKANDVYELVSMWVGRKRNLAWEDVNGKRGLQKELGWTRKIGGDTKYIETLLAKNGEGMGVDEFVHMVWESPENSVGENKRWDTEEIKEALLELLRSAQSKSDVVDYALNSRIAQAEAALKAQQEREAEQPENGTQVVEETPTNTNEPGSEVLPFPPTSEETPAVEKPAAETPSVEQPAVEQPTVAETQPEAPSVETPAAAEETPDAEMEERKKFIAEHPLTEEQIDASDANQMRKILAKQYLNLDNLYVSELAKAAYLSIYNKVNAQQTEAPATTETPQAEQPKSETKPEQPTEKPAPKQSAATQAAQAKVNAVLAKLKQHKKPANNDVDAYSVEKLTPEQLDDMLDLVEAGAELGYTLLDGVETKEDWMNQMRDMIGEQLKDATGYTDAEVNDLLEDLWNSPYSVDGTEKTVAEWAAEKGINVNEIENGTEETGNGNGNTSQGVAVGSSVGNSTETGVGEQSPNDEGNTGTNREEGGIENVPRGNNGTGVGSGEAGTEQPSGEISRGQEEGGNTTGQTSRRNSNESGGTGKGTVGSTGERGTNSGANGGNGTNVSRGTEQGGARNGQPSRGTGLGQSVGIKTNGEPGAPIMGQPETVNAKQAIEDITKEKVPYKPNSAPEKYAIGSVIPSGIADAIANAFKRLKEKFFPKKENTLDFVRKELGYKTNEEMLSDYESGKTDGLAAEQIDAVALAIGKMKEGKSFIVGDMTGVGKGRTAAALIRWGMQQKKKVLFITEKSGLFSDMYRDLTDIGCDYLPFTVNDDKDANITDADGNKVVPHPSAKAQAALWQSESDKLPADKKGRQYDFVMATYSQANAKKEKTEWLKEYAKDAIVILDESHNASGESKQGEFFQEVVKAAGGVTFLSATYAKRPDNMLLYAIRSSMNELHMSVGDMLQGIKDYGVAMQELMASALFGSGEMIRRERDMTDVKTTWTDPKEVYGEEEFEECRKTSDKTMALINDIIDFQRDVINPIVKAHEDEHKDANAQAALIGANQTHTTNTAYKSQVSNVVNLMTYAMKAKKAAEMAIEQIKQGKKPVIAVENTLDSYISELPDEIESADFGPIFEKGIKFSLKYMTAQYALNKKSGKYEKVEGTEQYFDAESELDEDGMRALDNLRQRVQEYLGDTDKIDLTLSPIDLVKQMIADAGYSCGEITGRKTQLVKQADGSYKKESIKQDKKGAARKFNGGSKKNPLPENEQYDALILNVAGATGISLHSSKTFGNQKPRTMIILQPARDVNTEVQMRGRIDRTGQVHRGEYFYVTSPIPAEQKITMMLKQKLASLDAQSSATKKVSSNKVEGQDMDNKYGDEVCYNYLLEHLQDINAFLEDGIYQDRKTKEWTYDAGLLYDVLKNLQRMPCDMQEQVITELSERYAEHIDYLNQNGINDLETTTMNLEAVTIDKATFVKGKDNDSENEFAHDTSIERVEVNVLKKPMRSSDIKKKMKDLDALDEDGLPKEGVLKQTTDKADEVVKQKLEERKAKFDEQEAKLEEKLRKDHPKKDEQTDEEYEEMINNWPSLVEMKMKHQTDYGQYQNDLRTQYNNVYRAAMYLKPGRPYLVPLTDDISSDGAMMYGRFLGFQMKNGDPRMIQAVFATKDSRVMISIPVHNKIKVIDKILNYRGDIVISELERGKYGSELSMAEKAKNWDEWWDKMIPKNTNRQIRYMITGNVLQACGTLGKYKGQIVTFTRKNKDTGEITLERGMLLAENFDPENFQIRRQVKKADIWDHYDEVKDDKSNISCYREGNHLVVKFDKRKNEKLSDHPAQKDEVLKGLLMNGELRPSRKDIVGVVKEENIEKVLEHLFKEYGYTKEELFVMPDSTEKPDAIVRTNRPYKEIIEQYKDKYGYSRYDVERKIKEMLKRYKMDVNNDNLKEEIREAVQLRQAYYRRDYANQESNRLAWEVLIRDQNIERFKDEKDYREREMYIKEAILEELESRGFKGNAYHYEQGKITTDDVKKMFDTMNDTSTEEGKAKKALFEKVMAKVEKLPMEIFLNEKMDNSIGGSAGGRVVNYNWKYMNADYIADQAKADTILHELIHTVTAYADRCVEDGLEHLLDQDMIDAINELHSIYDAIRNDDTFTHDGVRAYGLTNVREMLSEAGSNSEFRADLKKTGLWARLKAGFLAFFGIRPNQEQPSGSKKVNAYEQIMERLDYLIENFKQEAWEEYYKGTSFGGYGYKKQDAQKIDIDNPMEAMKQIGDNWKQEQAEKTKDDIAKFIYELPGKYGFKGTAITQVVNSREELEALRKVIGDEAYKAILETYNNPINEAAYVPRLKMVVIFNERMRDKAHAERTWWHEQTHHFWHTLSDEAQREYGLAVWNFLDKYYPETLKFIQKKYNPGGWYNEGCSFFIGELIKQYGTDNFLLNSFEDVPEISKFVAELKEFIQNGRKENEEGPSDSSEQLASVPRSAGVSERGDLRGRNNKQSRYQRGVSEEEIDRSISNPLDAIIRGADEFKDGQVNNPAFHSAKTVYDERLNRVETVFSEAYQDSMVSLKTAQNAIAKDQDIPDSQNAYMAENLMHGKNKNEQDLYNAMFRDPLIKTINKIMNLTGLNWGDVDRYVYTKSGLERNRELFVRDWFELERMKNAGDKAELSKLDDLELNWLEHKEGEYERLKNGEITYPEYLESLEKFIRANMDSTYIPSEHDYSGFTEMFGEDYDEADIINELVDTENLIEQDNVNQLWEQINAATRYGLERYRQAGMRSDAQIDRIESMFHFYVPMRGFKKETGEDMYQYFTSKGRAKNYVGGLLKHAKGRGSEAEYPISTIFAMSYKAIADCNQNLVNQKLYRLCQANPNDLIVLSDSWAMHDPITDEWKEVMPPITDDMDEEEVRQTTIDFEKQMNDLASKGEAKKIRGKAQFDYVPMDKKNKSEHIVEVRINGDKKLMIVTGNPRMAQALNGQLRFERGHNVFSKWNAAIKNFMASVFTSYSPTFALRNMFRDWTHFRTMLGVREGHGYASQANKYYRQSLFKMVGLFKKYREGTLDLNNEMEADFKDFMDNGGVTGFVQMMKVDDIQKELESLIKQQKQGKVIRLNDNVWMKVLDVVEAINEGIENNARFATFRASRHYAGRSKARSAYDAKEITVNFNRKGAGGKTAGFKSQSKMVEDTAKAFGVTSQILGEGRIFFNATVQAIATTFKNFQNPDGSLNGKYIAKWAAKYALPPFMLGLALPYINQMLAMALGGGDEGDDDPYANLAEWTRRKNICIYIGNGNFLTMPVGQELAVFLALGDMFAGMTYAPDLKPVDRSFDEEMVGILNTFSPVDVDTKITKGGLKEDPLSEVVGRSFSVLAPIVAVEQNLGWTGRPIYREDTYPSDKYNPEYQMVYNGTNPVLVGASKLANDLSGGDDVARGKIQVNPAIVQYLWEQYTGGPGKVFSNTISIGKDAKDILSGNDNDFNIRKVEGLKAFVQQGDDRTAYYRTLAKYRKYKADADELNDKFGGYKKSAAENPEAFLKLEKLVKSEDFVRMQIVKEADKKLSKLNKAANQSEGKQRKELRQLYNRQVKEVVDLLDQVGQE